MQVLLGLSVQRQYAITQQHTNGSAISPAALKALPAAWYQSHSRFVMVVLHSVKNMESPSARVHIIDMFSCMDVPMRVLGLIEGHDSLFGTHSAKSASYGPNTILV